MKVRANKLTNQIPHLTFGAKYDVVGLDHDSFRVVNDKEEPVIYPKDIFDVIDISVPDDWVWKKYSIDEYYAHPPELAERGFYEDWFDGIPSAHAIFEDYLKRTGIRTID